MENLNLIDFDQTIVTLQVEWNDLKKEFYNLIPNADSSNGYLNDYFKFKKHASPQDLANINELIYKYETDNYQQSELNLKIIPLLNKPYIIVSHNQHDTITFFIEHFKLPKPLEIFSKDRLDKPKPSSEQVAKYISSNFNDKTKLQMIGDSPEDEAFAINIKAGFKHVSKV